MNFTHERIEKNPWLLIALVVLVVSIGGLVEILPLFFQKSTTEPIAGLKPYSALRLTGRDIYVREGCYNCHSQMIRPFRAETERYGHYSVAGEFVYDRPFQWGSKRTGPDLARVGGRLILGLPGNPASAFVCARLFLRPLLDQMCSRDPGASMRTLKARVRTPLSANGARETYMRAALETDDTGQTWALPPARQDSSLLSVFANAQALIVRAPGAAEAPAGAIVDVLPR